MNNSELFWKWIKEEKTFKKNSELTPIQIEILQPDLFEEKEPTQKEIEYNVDHTIFQL